MHHTQRARLFDLVKQHATNGVIHELLKLHRDTDREIRISGNKVELLGNLSRAVDRGTIGIEDVVTLLARCEENGQQHIFLYRPLNTYATSARDIGVALWGKDWEEKMNFPKFYLDPEGWEWSDIRQESTNWILKLYFGEDRVEYERDKELGDNKFCKIYRRYRSRGILLVKWWGKLGILELRIPVDGGESQKRIGEYVDALWRKIAPGIVRSDFQPMCLKKARATLIQNAKSQSHIYRIPIARFRDVRNGTAQFHAADCEDRLHDSADREYAMTRYKDCEALVSYWLSVSGPKQMHDDLRVEIASYGSNSLRIGAETTPEAIQYVLENIAQVA